MASFLGQGCPSKASLFWSLKPGKNDKRQQLKQRISISLIEICPTLRSLHDSQVNKHFISKFSLSNASYCTGREKLNLHRLTQSPLGFVKDQLNLFACNLPWLCADKHRNSLSCTIHKFSTVTPLTRSPMDHKNLVILTIPLTQRCP